jgi:hemolysin activation/secretion protein
MIAEYQVDKLRQRLSQQVKGVGYRSFSSMKTSSYTFKYDGKWYRLSVKVEELPLDSSSNNDSVKAQK